LAVFPSGAFDCIKFQGDGPEAAHHRQEIFSLVGLPGDPLLNVPPTKPLEVSAEQLNWEADCQRLLRDVNSLAKLAHWRGWSEQFCTEITKANVIGLHENWICFPVREINSGLVRGRHVFAMARRKWRQGRVCSRPEYPLDTRCDVAGWRNACAPHGSIPRPKIPRLCASGTDKTVQNCVLSVLSVQGSEVLQNSSFNSPNLSPGPSGHNGAREKS